MDTPLVSIIIPAFNSQQTVQETIDSVAQQTYINWEVIVVDDCSEDQTFEIVSAISKNDDRIKIFKRTSSNSGGSVCRNIGISKSKGKYIIFLDSDDLLNKECLSNRVKYMQSNTHLDFAVFQMACFNENGVIPDSLLTRYKSDYLQSYLSHSLPWTITCPILKRDLVLKHGGFDERFPRAQDPEFFTRLLLDNEVVFEVLVDSEPDCFYRIAGEKKYKPMLEKMMRGFSLYITHFYDLTKDRVNAEYYQKALASCFVVSLFRYVYLSDKDNFSSANPIIKELYKFVWNKLNAPSIKMLIILPIIYTRIVNIRFVKSILRLVKSILFRK